MDDVKLRIWRGDKRRGDFVECAPRPRGRGRLRRRASGSGRTGSRPRCRWNCKAGKCGSCSAEINGVPRLMCMTRMDTLPVGEPVVLTPMRTFPIVRDLVTDVSFNYRWRGWCRRSSPGHLGPDGTYRMMQMDVERGQEFRKCMSASCARTSVT